MTKALFPGSFNPFTAGHLNILKRALTMFDEVIVAVGINQDKRGFFDMDQRIDIISQAVKGLDGVSIIKYDNLTIDTCHELGIRHIVRGVRNMIDFETERSIADANRRLAPDIETIIIPTAQEFAHISSSAVRDILKHHGNTSLFLPEGVVLPPQRPRARSMPHDRNQVNVNDLFRLRREFTSRIICNLYERHEIL